MGLQWGFELRNNNDKKLSLPLISFCSWNTQDLLKEIETCGKGLNEDNPCLEFKIDLRELYSKLKPLERLKNIFANTSDRQIDEWDISKKQDKLYNDMCYDLGIPFDNIIAFQLINLASFIDFLKCSEIFDEIFENTKENYLVLWESY